GDLEAAGVQDRLNGVLPDGMAVEEVAVLGADVPSAASAVHWADYAVALAGPDETAPPPAAEVAAAIAGLEADPEWMVARPQKPGPGAGRGRPARRQAPEPEDLRPRVAIVALADPVPEGCGP